MKAVIFFLKQEINIYKEIQKNTEKAIRALDTITDKVYDDNLALQLSKQSLKYAEIRNQAYDKLLEAKAEPYKSSYLDNMRVTGGIQYNTLLNTSTSKIAELIIKGSNTDVLEMNRVLNHNVDADKNAVELAKSLIDFEVKKSLQQGQKVRIIETTRDGKWGFSTIYGWLELCDLVLVE